MNFEPTDEQRLVQQTARDFAQRELSPRAAERDRSGAFPEDELRRAASLGLLGINVPEAFGGAEAGAVAYSLAIQELAYADPSVTVAVAVSNMVAELIARFGTEAQAERYVRPLVSGESLCGAFALSEAQAGSDPAAMTTSARELEGGGWRLEGAKQWISHGNRAGVQVVWAVTDPDAGHRGISAFVVPGDAPGLGVVRLEEKMGLHGSPTAQLVLDGVEVGADALLGGRGDGFKLAMVALDGGRIGISSQAIGTARCAFDAALRYSTERETFGVPIARHQAIANMLADMATWLEAAALMTLRAAHLKEAGRPFTKEASMAKLFATERAFAVCDLALQIHGGSGYTQEFPVERCFRDVRVTRIYEGTSEIQRIVIARQLLKDASR